MQSTAMHFSPQIAVQEFGVAENNAAADREARFAAMVSRQFRFVFKVAHSVLRNVEDAEDLAQEVFLKLYRSSAWQQMDDERAFLARATWRLAVSRAAKRNSSELDSQLAAREASPEAVAILSDQQEMVQRLIHALPEELRQALVLSAVEGLDSREIAGIMGISEGTVRTRQMRARALLKSKIAACLKVAE